MELNSSLICSVSLAPLRVESRDPSEMCTQALAGEQALLLEFGSKDWIRVRLENDGYEGWTDRKQWQESKDYGNVFLLQAPVSSWLKDDGSTLELIAGSQLILSESGRWALGNILLDPLDDLDLAIGAHDSIFAAAYQFMGAPYLWGGKSKFGMDCSGLIQVAFQLMGVLVPRDASEQASVGLRVVWQEHQVGDLVFFQNEEGRIVHVGMVASSNTLIHAAGEVRIDELRKDGVFRNGHKTHTMHSIKRWSINQEG